MGVNVLGPRKLRKLVRMTGLELDRALVYSHHGRVVVPHLARLAIDQDHPCWSSCEKLDIPLNRREWARRGGAHHRSPARNGGGDVSEKDACVLRGHPLDEPFAAPCDAAAFVSERGEWKKRSAELTLVFERCSCGAYMRALAPNEELFRLARESLGITVGDVVDNLVLTVKDGS